MNRIWPALLLCAIGFEVISGRGASVIGDMTACAMQAMDLVLTLLCGYMLWCGLIAVLEEAGALHALATVLGPVVRRIFPQAGKSEKAVQAICTNFSANMLGLGNAATPQGVLAVSQMRTIGGCARDIGLFITLNCSSVQLIPTTMMTLLAQYGALAPQRIWLPSLAATCLTTLCAYTIYMYLSRQEMRHGG